MSVSASQPSNKCQIDAFQNLRPRCAEKMFLHSAGASTLTWNDHFTDITTSIIIIFLCEMKPLCFFLSIYLLFQVSSSVDTRVWRHSSAIQLSGKHGCIAKIKIANPGGMQFRWIGQLETGSPLSFPISAQFKNVLQLPRRQKHWSAGSMSSVHQWGLNSSELALVLLHVNVVNNPSLQTQYTLTWAVCQWQTKYLIWAVSCL